MVPKSRLLVLTRPTRSGKNVPKSPKAPLISCHVKSLRSFSQRVLDFDHRADGLRTTLDTPIASDPRWMQADSLVGSVLFYRISSLELIVISSLNTTNDAMEHGIKFCWCCPTFYKPNMTTVTSLKADLRCKITIIKSVVSQISSLQSTLFRVYLSTTTSHLITSQPKWQLNQSVSL